MSKEEESGSVFLLFRFKERESLSSIYRAGICSPLTWSSEEKDVHGQEQYITPLNMNSGRLLEM